MPSRKKLTLLFFAIFFFRLFFGLCQSNWTNEDEKQSYLTGLKYYATGAWPYFGPDASGSESSFHSQVPGALEGLVIGLPLRLLPFPEAPFILVNLLSAAGVLLLTWYICKRIPRMSFDWLCLWITIAPWSLFYPSHISNMAYLYFSGILFFIGFMESLPFFSMNLISHPWANFLMGFSLFWIMQFHLSYVYLLPMAVFSMVIQWKNRQQPRGLIYFILGALPPLAFVIPTYLQYGLGRANSHSAFFIWFYWNNIKTVIVVLARFLSLVCFELPIFIGSHMVDRIAFLKNHPFIFVPGAFLWIAGLVQPFILLFSWFKKNHSISRWKETKWLTAAIFAMVYISFWFTIKEPLSHIYTLLFPWIMLYSCYCWIFFAENPRWRILAKIFLVFGFLFQVGYAVAVAPQNSVETQREVLMKAIQEKNYHLLGERTSGDLY